MNPSSLKKLAAQSVKWYGLETDVDIGPLVKDVCCKRTQYHSWLSSTTGREINEFIVACQNGHNECVRFWMEKKFYNKTYAIDVIVRNDRLNTLKIFLDYLREKQNMKIVLQKAAKYGRPTILNWALNQKPLEQRNLNDAAAISATKGHVVCFEMCLIYRPALSIACALKGKHSEILNMTLERTKPDARDFAFAAKLGLVRALESMLQYSNEWDETTPATASRWGNLACLRFAHENGCKWTSSTLITTHQECLNYALEHKCGSNDECLCSVSKKKKFLNISTKKSGKFFKNLSLPEDFSSDSEDDGDRGELILSNDFEMKTLTKRATLDSMLRHQPVLPRNVQTVLENIEPSTDIKQIILFARRCSIKRKEISKYFDLEGSAFEVQTQVHLDKQILKDVSHSWSDESFTIKLKTKDGGRIAYDNDYRISWFPYTDLIHVSNKERNFFGLLPRSKFLPTPKIRDYMVDYASFIFQRPFEEVCKIFMVFDYKKQKPYRSKASMYNNIEEMFPLEKAAREPLESPEWQTKFVIFLKEHQIGVSQNILDTWTDKNLYRAPGQYIVDHFVLQNGTFYDTRSRMAVPLKELLRTISKAPIKILFVLYLFSLPLLELNSFFEEKNCMIRTEKIDCSKIVEVSADYYCNNALLHQ